jgi:hypothetical protein
MPFHDPFNEYYEEILAPAVKAAKLEPIRADQIYSTGPVINDIITQIRESEIIIADVTGRNPNVNYELGLAHAFERPVIIISQNPDDIPFDYRHHRVITYDTKRVKWVKELAGKITKTIELVRRNPKSAVFWEKTEGDVIEEEGNGFQVFYGDRPSRAWVKTPGQFVLLNARAGEITGYMMKMTKEVLEDIKDYSVMLSGGEFLMLRGMWFNHYGSVVLYIDLLHDRSIKPTMTVDEIKRAFHDEEVYYGEQAISVDAKVIEVFVASDSFFPIDDEYYERVL